MDRRGAHRGIVLLTGLYQDPNPRRQRELLECLRRNVENDRVGRVDVFVESAARPQDLAAAHPWLSAPKVRLLPAGRRVTYEQLFAHANREWDGQVVAIANADIYFDQTLARLDGYDLTGRLLCLSRWDVGADGVARLFDFAGSQDAWVFAAPIREFPCAFHLGLPGCDNRLAWEAAASGLEVTNPARSVRAHHLHLSAVRRYRSAQTVAGPRRTVPADWLGTPWLWFIVPCRGRREDVEGTIGAVLAQPRSEYVLVDYSCPQRTGEWLGALHPHARVVAVSGQPRFHGAHARNQGARAADEDAILCFLDADVAPAPGFSRRILSRYREGSFVVPDGAGRGLDTALVCSRSSFLKAGGFDEAFRYWGQEVGDLRSSLRRAGLAERRFPATLLSHRPGAPRATAPGRKIVDAIHAAYRRAKDTLADLGRGTPASDTLLSETFEGIARAHLLEVARAAPCAAVAFREDMGYTLGVLEDGASSHNNDVRPMASIPPALAGRQFTQVVSRHAAPVEVEFLSAGKLYVLVGTDWEGYGPAIAWLRAAGLREPLPPLQTRRGTAFEVWSLLGEPGERFEIPTQVMLVSDHLERAPRSG